MEMVCDIQYFWFRSVFISSEGCEAECASYARLLEDLHKIRESITFSASVRLYVWGDSSSGWTELDKI